MPVWLKVAAGVALGVVLIGLAGLQGASKRLGPLVQEHGTTYYSNDGPVSPPVICKPVSTILAAIDQVHAKYDHLAGDDLNGASNAPEAIGRGFMLGIPLRPQHHG